MIYKNPHGGKVTNGVPEGSYDTMPIDMIRSMYDLTQIQIDDYNVRKTKFIADTLEYERRWELYTIQENIIWKGVFDASYDPLLYVPDRPVNPTMPTPYVGYTLDE